MCGIVVSKGKVKLTSKVKKNQRESKGFSTFCCHGCLLHLSLKEQKSQNVKAIIISF
jgi:hypothetical protein